MRYKNKNITLIDNENKECNVIQVTKTKAKNAFNNDKNVWLHPCLMRLNNVWQKPYCFNRKSLETKYNDTPNFDTIINHYKYYNCNNQLGTYPIYFIEK